jgi:protein gp37
MSEETKIEWAHATFNPWIGCTKVSPGCSSCYAENTTRARVLRKRGHETWGRGAQRSRTSETTWKQPLRWNLIAGCGQAADNYFGRKPQQFRVFPSLCDWLDGEVPIEWFLDFLEIIEYTPNLNWLLLTKRPEAFQSRLVEAIRYNENNGGSDSHHDWLLDWADGNHAPENVWIGTSVEDQKRADERIPALLQIPARVHFLSVEPLLEVVDLKLNARNYEVNAHGPSCGSPYIAWVVAGGESGPQARPCHIDWIRSVVDQCARSGTKCFVKQLGSLCVTDEAVPDGWPAGTELTLAKDAPAVVELKHKKGGDPAEWTEDLRVRQFPQTQP